MPSLGGDPPLFPPKAPPGQHTSADIPPVDREVKTPVVPTEVTCAGGPSGGTSVVPVEVVGPVVPMEVDASVLPAEVAATVVPMEVDGPALPDEAVSPRPLEVAPVAPMQVSPAAVLEIQAATCSEVVTPKVIFRSLANLCLCLLLVV